MSDYLDLVARQCRGWTHPHGRRATQLLRSRCEDLRGRYALDLGCGTGATLVRLAELGPRLAVGVDLRGAMLRRARLRHRFCADGSARWVCSAGEPHLPFGNGSFHLVTAESLLGFMPVETCRRMLAEIRRVLAPGGRWAFTDAFWLPRVDRTVAVTRAREERAKFGVPSASPDGLRYDDFLALVEGAGLRVVERHALDDGALEALPDEGERWRERLFRLVVSGLLRLLDSEPSRESADAASGRAPCSGASTGDGAETVWVHSWLTVGGGGG